MKYKELFKKWWFYLVMVFFAIRGLVGIHVPGESLYFGEILGSLIGSIPVTVFVMLCVWAVFLRDKKDKKKDGKNDKKE